MSNIVTIKDVAKKAGLSVSTVSRYLNNHPYISDEKKEKIKTAMAELDYVPSSAATQLRSNKSNSIGVIISNITNPYYAYLVNAIEQQARALNYQIIFMQTNDDKNTEIEHLNRLKDKTVSGLILCSIENDISIIEKYNKFGPIVLCSDSIQSSEIAIIHKNQKQITYTAIEYLIEKGCKKIAYCTGGDFDKGHGRLRNEGFIQAITDYNLYFSKDLIFTNAHNIEDGKKIGKSIINLPHSKRPDAIFAGSDEVAAGIQHILLNEKILIPDEVKIIGFDNQPISELLPVPLTTIEQPVTALGSESAKLIIHLINNETYEVEQTILKLKMIFRESA